MTVRLQLDEFEFLSFEIPPGINLGGHQVAAVHRLIGGERVVNAMGKDDDDKTWVGRFFGENAEARVRFLDTMRVSGKEFILTYSSFRGRVMIKYFKVVFKSQWNLVYHIQLIVVEDLSSPVNVLPIGDYSSLIEDALLQAYDLAFLIKNDPIDAAIALLNIATANVDFSDATVEAINIAIAAATTARAVVNQQNAAIVSSIFGLGGNLLSVAPLQSSAPTSGGLSNDVLAEDLEQSNNMYALSAILSVAIKNLNLITQGSNGQTVIVLNANLYALASHYYNDVRSWVTIAEANNLSDPDVSSTTPVTLVIPLTSPTRTGILGA